MVDEVRAALSRLVAATLRRQAASFDVDYDCRDDANYALGNVAREDPLAYPATDVPFTDRSPQEARP